MNIKPLQCRAGLLVYFVPCSNYKPDRYCVKIQDFPSRMYSVHSAPDDMRYKPEHFARRRIEELNLDWNLSGMTYLEGIGYVFAIGG